MPIQGSVWKMRLRYFLPKEGETRGLDEQLDFLEEGLPCRMQGDGEQGQTGRARVQERSFVRLLQNVLKRNQ